MSKPMQCHGLQPICSPLNPGVSRESKPRNIPSVIAIYIAISVGILCLSCASPGNVVIVVSFS